MNDLEMYREQLAICDDKDVYKRQGYIYQSSE